MKILPFTIISAAIILQLTAAIPHRHNHQHEHVKKSLAIETFTKYTTVAVAPTNPAVIVWVDNNGNTVSTETIEDLGYSSTITQEATSNIMETTVETKTTITALRNNPSATHVVISPLASPSTVPVTSTPSPAPATTEDLPTLSTAPVSSAANNGGAKIAPGGGVTPTTGGSKDTSSVQTSGLGIAYDLLNDSGTCKSAATVEKDFDDFAGAYSMVRIYNTDCNAVQLVTAQAAKRGMKVLAGIGNNHLTTGLAANLGLLVSQAGQNLNVIDTIIVGNEYVGSSVGPASNVVSAIAVARVTLAGVFGGSIVTADTVPALTANTQLCGASDYCAANCHAYFATNVAASGAGAFVQSQVSAVAAVNGGKRVVITESGWPWKSAVAGNTQATEAAQDAAIASLRGAFSSDLVLFQGFDTKYKQDQGDGTEWYFGMYYHDD